jgi:thiol:disulfide interchange protein
MKYYFYLLVVTLILSTCAFGQTAQPATPPTVAAPAQSKESKETPVVRERFDPTRDAKADLATAVQTAAKSGKNIILDVGGEWCSWCVFMDNFFIKNPDLAKLRDTNYVWVKINFSKENENKEFLSAYPEPAGYPHLFVLDPAGKLLQSQDTSELEEGKGYNLDKFMEFLKKWAPEQGRVDPSKSVQKAN